MKATVEQYAKGDFQFNRPEIILSEQSIKLKVEAGSVYTGSLSLSNTSDTKMKVMAYDDKYLFTFDQHIFVDRVCNITYHFDGTHFEQGKTIRGNINIITEGGEFVIPYLVEIVPPYVSTSMGPVKDMFQFATLAERSWSEALRLFESEDFENTFLAGQPQLEKIFDSLKISLSANQALEEFLVFIHKKKVLSLSMSPESINIDRPEKRYAGRVRITRNTWGFTNTLVYTDVPFITVSKPLISSEDFFGNDYSLEYFIEPSLLEGDVNVGHIYIENVYQKLSCEIIVGTEGEKIVPKRNNEQRYRYKSTIVKLVESYIDFRIGRLSAPEYIERSLSTLTELVKLKPDNKLFRLGVLHMQLLTGEVEYVKQECKRMEADDVGIIHGDKESCYYQYIKSVLTKDPDAVRKAASMVKRYLDADDPDLFYYWLYMHVAEEFKDDQTALYRLIERLYNAGKRSPIMYIEICDLFNQEPLMFRKLTALEQSAIHWGIREDFVSAEVKQTYVLLAGREKGFNKKIFRNLETIYGENASIDCLKVMTSMLISGNQLGHEYNKYYSLAIDESLRIIGLNECFLRSMDLKKYNKIPYPVLKYLNYKNTLTEKETAYLYANIITNKDEYVNIYHDYIGNIEAFMGEQILKGNMSDDLCVIYEEFLDPAQVSEKYAFQLINIIFKRKLIVANSHIRSVAVKHRELAKEVIVPVIDGVAYIELITDTAAIALLDEYGNRYISTIPYRLEKLVEERFYIDICYKYSPFDYRLLLYLHANAKKLMGQNIQEINLARELIHKKELSSVKREEALVAMIRYYDAHYDSSILQRYLDLVNENDVTAEESCYIISLMIQEGLYKKAYVLIGKYGFENIADEKLLRLVSFLTNEPELMHDEQLTAICVRLYEHDKYGETVLRHLTTHYRGTTDALCTLWKRSKGVISDTRELEENALAQLMFTDQISDDIYDIFSSYYYGRNRGMVVKGFLKQTAFRYVIGGAVVPNYMFDIMYKEIEKENLSDDLTSMALLMYHSTVTVPAKRFDWVRKATSDFVKRDKILPFFKSFSDIVNLPADIYCKTYLVHRSGVHKKIRVSYSFDSTSEESDVKKEDVLDEMLPGLYVKEFVVFRGERLLYEILDKEGQGVTTLIESDVLATGQYGDVAENRFAFINEMLKNQEMMEHDTLVENISHYLHVLHLFDENLKIL
ncbi:MAG: hypothetical protein IKQ71_02455 [Lachnospiraceae bacterium]|nr:hypothetical protein [Lachnospiraceae bacterium]